MRNRILALVVCCAMLVTLFTGCTQAEKNFIALSKEMSSLKVLESSGKIMVNFNKLPSSLTNGQQSLETDLVKAMLSNLQINFRSKADQTKQLSESTFYLVDPKTGKESEIVTVLIKNNVFYIKVRELVGLAKIAHDPKLDKALEVGLGDADYISMTMEEYLQVVTGDKIPASMLPITSGNMTERAMKQQTLFFGFLDGLMTKVYDKYELGMIKQEGTKYTLTLDAASMATVIKPFLKYSLLNAEKLGDYLKEYLAGTTPQDLAILGLPLTDTAMLKPEIDKFVEQIALQREPMLAKINNLDLDSLQGSQNPLKDSKMVLSMEKKDGAYLQNVLLNLVLALPQDSLDMVIKTEQVTKTCSSFEVDLPLNRIVSLSEFTRRITQEMQVNIDAGTYVISDYDGKRTGKMVSKLNAGYTYLPIRQLAEALDETVDWDSTAKQAYVIQDGKKTVMQGLNIKGTVYIKLRDFEKLGYKVVWDAQTRTATIRKTMFF